ncbi:hypothetical protein J8L88_23220 [Aquimarina sp. MMG015]|uniref:hypothetical protein n=1 Tax=Aquimarina TaxID=290174 RepID=UPI000557B94B|nr:MULTISPECIES: hypothetical protein [Aquimarina]AXT57632.1 hypothetical protein D1815_18435 [Aquimarina sp. AD1]MBQ4805792.1 hypothetical protein [Aquimarina sp. MMG015]RKN29036.1 hypothetical protein D7035_07320 [Aquimarina sp. AD1]
MRSLLLLFAVTLLFSCKTQQKGESLGGNEDIEAIAEDELLTGKVLGKRKKKMEYVAVKLVVDENTCMKAYTDKDGLYDFLINPSKLKADSYFEFVYKGYAKKQIPYSEIAEKGTVTLSTKGEVVTTTDYRLFYEAIRSCKDEL